jgi:CRP/FNR family transcriptional regulator, cyclic AMP receptor protein
MITAQDLLAAHPFLEGLSPEQLMHLSAWAHRSQFHAGARIFSEGGQADRFWLIRDGHVTLDAHVPGRGEMVIETLGPGSVLGWSWLFPPYRWHFGATAVEPTLTVELDGPGIRRLCESDPALGFELTKRFIQVVVDRLQATRVRLLDLYQSP